MTPEPRTSATCHENVYRDIDGGDRLRTGYRHVTEDRIGVEKSMQCTPVDECVKLYTKFAHMHVACLNNARRHYCTK